MLALFMSNLTQARIIDKDRKSTIRSGCRAFYQLLGEGLAHCGGAIPRLVVLGSITNQAE